MPICRFHSVEHPVYKFPWHSFMEEVAHRIHKHHPRRSPTERLGQTIRAERKVKTHFVRVPRGAPEPFGEPLGIAVVASARDLGATGHGIPGCVRPFDRGFCAHAAVYRKALA